MCYMFWIADEEEGLEELHATAINFSYGIEMVGHRRWRDADAR